MANTKITDLPTKQSVADSDYLVVDDGNTTYKAEKSKIANSTPFSFVGMVVQGTNLTTQASVKQIYGDDTSWALLSSVALASENVFGNGYNLGLSDGTNLSGLYSASTSGGNRLSALAGAAYGVQSPASSGGSGAGISQIVGVGVPTKTQLANNLNYSGLVANTITVYTWERTA